MSTTALHDGGCFVQFVPFIQGPRNCLGQYFALLEARIVLGLLIKVSILDLQSAVCATCFKQLWQSWLPTLCPHTTCKPCAPCVEADCMQSATPHTLQC